MPRCPPRMSVEPTASAEPTQLTSPPPRGGPLVVAVQGAGDQAFEAALSVKRQLRARFPGHRAIVLVTVQREGAVTLAPLPSDGTPLPTRDLPVLAPAASQGAVPASASPLGPLFELARTQEAAAVAVVAAEPHDEASGWLDRLLGPIVADGFDFVCPAYDRHRTEGAINTGIVAPLIRTLYGKALRQPLGTEAALSGAVARGLLSDEDWRRRPAEAGSDAWLVAKVLGSDARVAQSWLGPWPRPAGDPEELSVTLVRALGLVFGEMERTASRWQRSGPSSPVPTFGEGRFLRGGARPDPVKLAEAFALGLRELHPILGLVLPPATLLPLQQAAGRGAAAGSFPDAVWARVIFDFAVAHLTRAVERRQLLRSLTPLYLGWLAGLAHDAEALDDAAFEARVEAIGAAFEREKRYLVARWRWPDEFNP